MTGVIKRPCLGCGRLVPKPASRCIDCTPERPKQIDNRRNRYRPHYGGDYAARAKIVRDTAVACWICGEPARDSDPFQADHVLPRNPDSPLLAAHRSCNIRRRHLIQRYMAGGKLSREWVVNEEHTCKDPAVPSDVDSVSKIDDGLNN